MATVLKPNRAEVASVPSFESDITVEDYLTQEFEKIVEDLRSHSTTLITKLKNEYSSGISSLRNLHDSTTPKQQRLCVQLKVNKGPHLGQRFMLEPQPGKLEGEFKIGRSNGRAFKERGVSLYKDLETSTSHAKIEIRNALVFLTDMKSTNGTLLNGKFVEAHEPMRLKDGDIVMIGGSELRVGIVNVDDDEH